MFFSVVTSPVVHTFSLTEADGLKVLALAALIKINK